MRNRLVLLGLIACFIFVGCASIKPWGERTPQEKLLAFYQTYNSQFMDALRLSKDPNLSEAGKEQVRLKKRLLTEVRPLLGVYQAYVDGEIPLEPGLENRILSLLDRLAGV